jgi:hypothetical protein
MRSINHKTWKTRFTWKPFQEKTKKNPFIIIYRFQPIVTNICRHQSPLVQILVGIELLLHIFVDTNILQTPIPTTKNQLSKRHQYLCLSGTNLLLQIFVETNILKTPIPTSKYQLSKRHQSLYVSYINLH